MNNVVMYNSQGNASEREELHSEFCSVFFVDFFPGVRECGGTALQTVILEGDTGTATGTEECRKETNVPVKSDDNFFGSLSAIL